MTWSQTRAFRLHRQHVTEPLGRSLRRVVRDLGGIQAQHGPAAEMQCGLRARGLSSTGIADALWEKRTLVKTWAMRGTLHWIDADDFPVWAAAGRTRAHWTRPGWLRAYNLEEGSVRACLEAVKDALDGRCLTRAALADEVLGITGNKAIDAMMRSGWGSLPKIVASEGFLCFGPSDGRNITFVRPDQWLPNWKVIDPEEAIRTVLRRYLATHGPATREEFARWWGFGPAQAGKVINALGDEVVEVERDGATAYLRALDVEDCLGATEDDEVRVLGMFDAYTLAGLPHDEIVPAAHKDEVLTTGAWVQRVVLRGGRVVGVWKPERKAGRTAVEVNLFRKRAVSKSDIRAALEAVEPYIGDISALTMR